MHTHGAKHNDDYSNVDIEYNWVATINSYGEQSYNILDKVIGVRPVIKIRTSNE